MFYNGLTRSVFSNPFEIWQVSQQHCCWATWQILRNIKNSKLKFAKFQTLQYFAVRHVIEYMYWNWPQDSIISLFGLTVLMDWVMIVVCGCVLHIIINIFFHSSYNNLLLMYYDSVFHCRSFTTVVNSLWPGDAMWWHKSGSTLAQVRACCLTAPSHYQNQCWLIVNGFHGIHMREVSQEILMISICKMSWKTTLWTFLIFATSQGPTLIFSLL